MDGAPVLLFCLKPYCRLRDLVTRGKPRPQNMQRLKTRLSSVKS